MRIALCGYDEHNMPDDWECYHWKAIGGYSNAGNKNKENRHRETIWFSPTCINNDILDYSDGTETVNQEEGS
jgi:hypothetical protein